MKSFYSVKKPVKGNDSMAKKNSDIPSPKTAKQYKKIVLSGTRHYEKGEFAHCAISRKPWISKITAPIFWF